MPPTPSLERHQSIRFDRVDEYRTPAQLGEIAIKRVRKYTTDLGLSEG
jgi:hypothetical protein